MSLDLDDGHVNCLLHENQTSSTVTVYALCYCSNARCECKAHFLNLVAKSDWQQQEGKDIKMSVHEQLGLETQVGIQKSQVLVTKKLHLFCSL